MTKIDPHNGSQIVCKDLFSCDKMYYNDLLSIGQLKVKINNRVDYILANMYDGWAKWWIQDGNLIFYQDWKIRC